MDIPETIEIQPARKPIEARVRVPGSKSFTNRALPIAALAEGPSRLTGVLDSEDTQVMMRGLRALGIEIRHDAGARTVKVAGCGGRFPAESAELFLANSGTSIRFLTALVATGVGSYVLDGIDRMRERPIGDLLAALRSLGVDAGSVRGNDCPPVVVRATGLPGGSASVRGDVSSQFLSALLMIGPLAREPLTITVAGPLVSLPYIEMTLSTMAAFGARLERDGDEAFRFPGAGGYVGVDYAIEPDASAASYFFASAAITGGSVTVEGLGTNSQQGDLAFVRELERMGCHVDMHAASTTVRGGTLHGIDADLCHLSDTVPTLAAVACFADSPTNIRNVMHIRRKECDRITALTTELSRAGLRIEERADGMVIHPGPITPIAFDTYDDHRMAMSLALLGLRVPGVVIRDPACTAKTYPDFFSDLRSLTR